MSTVVTPVCLAAANVRRWNTQSLGGRLMETTRTVLCTCLRPWVPKMHGKLQRSKTVKVFDRADVDFAQRSKERVSTYLHAIRGILQDDEKHNRYEGSRVPDDLLMLARDVVGQCVMFIDMCEEYIALSKVPFTSSAKPAAATRSSSSYYGNDDDETSVSTRRRRATTPGRSQQNLLFQGASPPRYEPLIEDFDDGMYTPRKKGEKALGFFIQHEAANFSETRRPKVAPRAQTPPASAQRSRQSASSSRHWMHSSLPPSDSLDPVDMVTNNRESISPTFSPSPRRGGAAAASASEHRSSAASADYNKQRSVCKSLAVPIDYLSDPRRLSPRQRSSIEGAVRSVVNRPELSDEDRMWLVSTMRRLRCDDELSLPH